MHDLTCERDDVLRAQERLPAEPILIGHSMGGFVAQKALERHPFPAIVLLCSVPPTGLAGSLLHMLLSSPLALLEMNLFMTGKRKPHRSLVEALFHHLPPEADLARYLAASGPESLRAIWDMMGFSRIDRTRQHPAPVHVFGAEHDKIIPPDQVETTARFYGTTARIARSAMRKLRDKGIKAGLIRPITLWPFPNAPIQAAATHAKCFLTVEMSMGQMVPDVAYACNDRNKVAFHGRTGGNVPTVDEVVTFGKEVMGGDK